MRVYMQIPAIEEKPSRYYQLLLLEDLIDGWTLVREWGQQGRSGRVKRDHFENQIMTLQAWISLIVLNHHILMPMA